ncbi:MAG: lysophospholipid acyltransferase family protein [Steroidobacterales bacterium]
MRQISSPTAAAPAPITLLGWLYAVYAWTLFLLLGVAGILVLWLLPALAWRRSLGRALARTVLRLTGMRIRCAGLLTLPHPCIVVANHSSFIDGVVLAAALPPHFSFVIKREMATVPLAGMLLKRLGAHFVERHLRSRSAVDARRLLRSAARGQALVFFPEGTFSPAPPGLLRFHIGAFAAAVKSQLPVVPIAIHGARARLPPGSLQPHPGEIGVEILPALAPPSAAGGTAAALRDLARAQLLAALGEADLADAAESADTAVGTGSDTGAQ